MRKKNDVITIKAAHVCATNHPFHLGLLKFKEIVEKKSNGRMNVKIFMSGQLGKEKAVLELLKIGQTQMALTGGICPVTACTKGLLNGQCGGASEGMCEVDPERECGWDKIYKRLEKMGRTDLLKTSIKPRDYSRMLPLADLRRTPFYDLEQG